MKQEVLHRALTGLIAFLLLFFSSFSSRLEELLICCGRKITPAEEQSPYNMWDYGAGLIEKSF